MPEKVHKCNKTGTAKDRNLLLSEKTTIFVPEKVFECNKMGIEGFINRDGYLSQLAAGRHNGLIKIITGLRRVGKSFLLFRLFRKMLIESDVADDHIIEVAFDDVRMESLRNPQRLVSYIEERMRQGSPGRWYYILLDEVQLLPRFTDVLNTLLRLDGADIYVTGSNSRFLSSDIATDFRGRGDVIHLYPLTFAELYNHVGGDKTSLWRDYYIYGGLPQVYSLSDRKKKEAFLLNLTDSVYMRDIVERHHVRNRAEMRELAAVMASTAGSPCNPQKIANTFRSAKGIVLERKTVGRYLSHMEDAFLIEKALRYDIKGRKYIGSQAKYYFQDMGIRNALLSFRQAEENHIMENVIYNELRARGFMVDVGVMPARHDRQYRQLEVDFVANAGSTRYYIQSVFAMPDDAKREQERASLRHIGDSFRRIIIVRDDIASYYDVEGNLIIGLFDFLLNGNSLGA